MNPMDKYGDRAKKLLKILFSGKYGQIFTSPFVMAETGTTIAVRNPNNAADFVQKSKELFVGDKKLAILLRPSKKDENEIWELMKKTNQNIENARNVVSWVDCSNIILCKKHRIEYIASFDAHFDVFLHRIK